MFKASYTHFMTGLKILKNGGFHRTENPIVNLLCPFKMTNSRLLIGLLFLSVISVLNNSCSKEQAAAKISFPANKAFAVFVDASDVVWVGTDKGLVSFYDGHWKTHPGNGTEPVVKICKYNGNRLTQAALMLTTGSDIFLASCKNDSVFTYLKTENQYPSNTKVTSLIAGRGNENWISSSINIGCLTRDKWYFTDDWGDLTIAPVISIAAQSDGWVFAGTSGKGVGRYKYDELTDAISGASYYTSEWTILPSDTILCILTDANNGQWIGTPQGLAYHQVWETKKGWTVYTIKEGLASNRIQAIAADKDGKIWVGTDSGVSHFDGKTWKNVPASSDSGINHVNDIAIDSKGIVWAATDSGVSSYNGTNWLNYKK